MIDARSRRNSHIDNFNDVFGSLYRHLFHVLPLE